MLLRCDESCFPCLGEQEVRRLTYLLEVQQNLLKEAKRQRRVSSDSAPQSSV